MSRLKTARPQARAGATDWYRIRNLADNTVEVVIYDEIGWFGVSASQFLQELREITASRIDLRLNSPGGEVFDGIAIYNLLRSHKAHVTTYVDSLAASIASVIALAGDRVVMQPHSQLMIHNPWMLVVGDANDLRDAAGRLDRHADDLAAIYAEHAGGTVAEWRERMSAEEWFTAEEAVAAGLAHEVGKHDQGEETPNNQWDLSVFRYAGREHAPAPAARAAIQTLPDEPGAHPTEGEATMPALDEGLRERLGLEADADEASILTAVDDLMEKATAPPPAPEPVVQPEPVAAKLPEGTTIIDKATLDDLRAKAALGVLAHERQATEDRDRALDDAIKAGKFPPARREAWAKLWDADPEGTRQTLASLAEGTVPLVDNGEPGGEPDRSSENAAFDRIFSKPGA